MRSVKRTGHEGNLQGGKAAAIVNRMVQKKELPKLSEGFARITCGQSESDVQSAVDAYSGLGPLDTLPSGYFGQKDPGAKIQLGIMKFLKETDGPANTESTSKSVPDSNASQITEEKEIFLKGTGSLSEKSDFFMKIAMKECVVDVKLMKRPIAACGNGEKVTNYNHFCSGKEGVMIVNACYLGEALGYESSFILLN